MNKRFKEKSPIVDNICKLSIDHEKLYAQRFQGNPVRIVLLRKKAVEYKDTFQIGRSHGVHAEPITFGLKLIIRLDVSILWTLEIYRQVLWPLL